MSTKKSKHEAVVIIPTYTNTAGLNAVIQCLKSHADYQVIIVNNNPDNNLAVSSVTEDSDILAEKKNAGFAKACDDGAQHAQKKYDPKYLVFLNDDVVFENDWIKMCISVMKNAGWSACTPILKRPDGSIENVGYRVLKKGKIDLETRNTKHETHIDGVTAAAIVVETAVFKELGGFDESFFAYLEDVDFCLRLTKAGKTFGVAELVFVTHIGQQTSSKMSAKKAWLDFRNWIKLINRHWSREEKMKFFPAIIVERLRNISGFIRSFRS